MKPVCRFTNEGVDAFRSFLSTARTDPTATISSDFLWNPSHSKPIDGRVPFSRVTGRDRRALAEYADSILASSARQVLEVDQGFWAWLVAANWMELCLRDKKTSLFGVGRDESYWIPSLSDHRRCYRHRFVGPYRVLAAHRTDVARAMGYLCVPRDVHHEIIEQMLSTEEFAASPAVAGVVTKLYLDASTRSPKRGTQGKGPGSPRRLVDVLNQFALTYDLSGLEVEHLISMLPREFERYLRPSR